MHLVPLTQPFASAPACRFAAVVELEMALTGNPDKKLLMRALARRRDNQFDNFFERLSTELFITGTASCPSSYFWKALTLSLFSLHFHSLRDFFGVHSLCVLHS